MELVKSKKLEYNSIVYLIGAFKIQNMRWRNGKSQVVFNR